MTDDNATVTPGGLHILSIETLDDLPPWANLDDLESFFHNAMKPYHDDPEDVRRGLLHALSDGEGNGGFILLARDLAREILVGGLTMLDTGMKGYVPENLLLFVAVHPDWRGRGIGANLITKALSQCEGAVKLHVEEANPARRLYNRLGFEEKYIDMRWKP